MATRVKNIADAIFFTPELCAAKGPKAPLIPSEKYAFQSLTYKGFEIGVFSDGISGALGRLAAQSSGAKNLVSTRFFTL